MDDDRFITSGYKIYDKYNGKEYLVESVDADDLVKLMNNLDLKGRERSKALSKLQRKWNRLSLLEDYLDAEIEKVNKSIESIRENQQLPLNDVFRNPMNNEYLAEERERKYTLKEVKDFIRDKII